MKIKKAKLSQKLLELYLIKSRAYELYDLRIQSTTTSNINQILAYFKKVLRILFKFHIKNKKILFLGLNGLILKKINKKTIHTALPLKTKLQGIISNNKMKFKNNLRYSLLKLKKKPDLIVILDKVDDYFSLLNESYVAKIPTITFSKTFAFKKNTSLYNNTSTTYEFLLHNKKFFYNCLKFLLKKPKILKNKVKNEKKKI